MSESNLIIRNHPRKPILKEVKVNRKTGPRAEARSRLRELTGSETGYKRR